MTTATWSSRVRDDSDATYQEWRDELITKLGILVTAGVLAADETNITPGAGARPATNTEQGYAVYHLSDSLHGTAPIYFRLGFGTAVSASGPRLQLTTGTSTNGSGVLGGTCLSTIASVNSGSAQTGDTARSSYLCAVEGFVGLQWKVDTSGSTHNGAEGFFHISRTVDSDGVPTADGAIVSWGAASVSVMTKTQAFRFAAPAAAYAAQTLVAVSALGINPQAPTSTAVGSDIQVAVGWTITPRVAPVVGVCGFLPTEISAGATFIATLVGSTARTYLALWVTAGPFGPTAVNASGGLAYAMLWE